MLIHPMIQVLFVNSAIITVFSLSNFRVIHQNPSSLSYYGDVTCQDEPACALSPESSAASIGQKAMLHIFSLDTGKLHRMLEDVRRGGVGKCWKGKHPAKRCRFRRSRAQKHGLPTAPLKHHFRSPPILTFCFCLVRYSQVFSPVPPRAPYPTTCVRYHPPAPL